jgi:lipopolysaccharide transport system ATP-binding protein
MDTVVSFDHVYKRYRRRMKGLSRICGFLMGLPSKDDFWAIRDVSFDVHRGDSFGIIGGNGAGKSTLLKILAGVTKQNKGGVRVSGRIGPLLELGAGLNPKLTGRENIYLYGAIHGMSRGEIRKKFQEIVAFSGLEPFLDTPLKHYSTGMFLRLGFSVAVHTDPDILLVDEVLAVGDGAFQVKCLKKIDKFHASGGTIILVSHSPHLVRHYTNRCLWMEEGEMKGTGPSQDLVADYLRAIGEHNGEGKSEGAIDLEEEPGKETVVSLIRVRCLDEQGCPAGSFTPRSSMAVEIAYRARRPQAGVLVGLAILREGIYVFGSKTHIEIAPEDIGEERSIILRFPRHPFLNGHYSITVGMCRDEKWYNPYCYHKDVLSFGVEPTKEYMRFDGWVLTEHSWEKEET